jgi:hypothetical protein
MEGPQRLGNALRLGAIERRPAFRYLKNGAGGLEDAEGDGGTASVDLADGEGLQRG